MPAVGFETWYRKQCPTVFVVKNIAPDGKRIRIFQYPIKNGAERDLMAIPYVSEADIRHSLLKGELKVKLLSGEAIVTESNIDLLQFDECHRDFLESYGVTKGTRVTGSGTSEIPFNFIQGVPLIGDTDNSNTVFTTPDKFINGTFGNNEFRILIRHNGRVLAEQIDYFLSESGGSGTGFDTIVLTFAPKKNSVLIADYIVEATP